MKQSVWTAGKIYEEVHKMRKELEEIDKALNVIDEEIGSHNVAFKLLDQQRTDKFKELQAFERQVFTQGNHNSIDLSDFTADTPASRPRTF